MSEHGFNLSSRLTLSIQYATKTYKLSTPRCYGMAAWFPDTEFLMMFQIIFSVQTSPKTCTYNCVLLWAALLCHPDGCAVGL